MKQTTLLLVLLLLCGCTGAARPAVTDAPQHDSPIVTSSAARAPIQSATSDTHIPVASPIEHQAVPSSAAIPPGTPTPLRTIPAGQTSTLPQIADPSGVLVGYGEDDLLTLVRIDAAGIVWPLNVTLGMLATCWDSPHLGPDGEWLSYLSPDRQDSLRLYNLQTQEERTINGGAYYPATPIFDTGGQRIAYVSMTYLRGNAYEWAIHIRDLGTGIETRFDASAAGDRQPWDEPIPGKPFAWLGVTLLLDGFVPQYETVNWGIRLLDLDRTIDGGAALPQSYNDVIVDPRTARYLDPTLSPMGDLLSFAIWDYDYIPSCRDGSVDDGSVTELWVIPATGGVSRLLVDASASDGALTGQPLVWSPDGAEILYAQAFCTDGSSPLLAELRTVDLHGSVAQTWPQAQIGYDWGCQKALWCRSTEIFYLRGEEELWRLELKTGRTERVLSSREIRLIGCLP